MSTPERVGHSVLFVTDRGERHQRDALTGAPALLSVRILRGPSAAELLRQLPGAEFLISERQGTIDAAMIAAGKKLRLIQRLGSLAYDIDLDAARAAGVPVSAWPVEGAILVAEHLCMQMLALTKRLPEVMSVANDAGDWGRVSRRTDEDTFAYNWSRRRGIGTLHGKTVGILGFGEIGVELARRLRGFDPARILYQKRSRLPAEAEAHLGLAYAGIGELLAESDLVCNLLPYSPETDRILNAERLAGMKPGACLVSCGSGSVIDEAALAGSILAGHLAGAALDTFEWEPLLPDNPLLALARTPAANVLLTPHTAGGGESSSNEPWRRKDYDNLVRVIEGKPVLYRVA